jgi:hypothetical protein
MKKFTILLVAVLAFFATACEQTKTEIQQRQAELADEIYSEWTNINKPKIYLFTYKGHDMVYIILHEGSDHAVGGFFHDPECRKCNGHIHENTYTDTGATLESVKQKQRMAQEKLSEYEKIFGKH